MTERHFFVFGWDVAAEWFEALCFLLQLVFG
jgi:hypothetical protein